MDLPQPEYLAQRLQIRKMWNVSTGHVTSKDVDLYSQQSQLSVVEYAHGALIYVPPQEDNLDYILGCLIEEGMSPAFTHIISIAHSNKLDWVQLDSDGEIYGFLEQFHW